VQPKLAANLMRWGLSARLELSGDENDKLFLH
jgi:hypothetical protein